MPTIRSVTKAWRDQVPYRMRKALDRSLHVLAAKVESNAPKDTGQLAKSVHANPARIEGQKIRGEVVVTDPVAHLQEFGTIHMPAHPFFRPAIESETPKMISLVRDETR